MFSGISSVKELKNENILKWKILGGFASSQRKLGYMARCFIRYFCINLLEPRKAELCKTFYLKTMMQ